MDKKDHIDKMVDEALNSLDNIERASPAPYLLTRVRARLTDKRQNTWERLVALIGRPAFAIPALLMLIFINVAVVLFNRSASFNTEQLNPAADEFSLTVATIYDIENSESE